MNGTSDVTDQTGDTADGGKPRIAVVLFNLGGPDNPEAVRPFLFNLFHDPAIIGLRNPLRWLLAKLISTRRAPVARDIYDEMGGRSPILPETETQARALTEALADVGEVKCFVCMRYWHPMTVEVVEQVKAFAPDRVVLLPLYPQFSTTTSASSFRLWRSEAKVRGLVAPETALCCYPTQAEWIDAMANLTARGIDAAKDRATDAGRPLVLFSAHGLPKKIVEKGDPYQWQVERSVAAIVAKLGREDFDSMVCYQSRVGPLEWIGPSTETVIEEQAEAGRAIVVVPVAFVSEHSETLVELDIEYRELAQRYGAAAYVRVPTVSADATFIAGLAKLVRFALANGAPLLSEAGGMICPAQCGRCPHRAGLDYDAVKGPRAAA